MKGDVIALSHASLMFLTQRRAIDAG
jgi:hypothetical protein